MVRTSGGERIGSGGRPDAEDFRQESLSMDHRSRRLTLPASLTLVVLAAMSPLAGCKDSEAGALLGAGAGAGLGAVIGHQSGHAGEGAAIGAAAGALGGYIIGNESDKKKDRESGNYDY
jgi:hypothetical protein